MARRARSLGVVVAVLAGAAVGVRAVPPDEIDALRSGLERDLLGAGGPSARWGVLAVSLDTGDTLFARSPTEPLAPASNVKLVTTAAALHHLGPDFRYETLLLGDGPIRDGTLEGDLILYGTGDPGLSDRFHGSPTAMFEVLADGLLEAGVRRVTGDVVGDGSFFGGPLFAEGWDRRDLDDWYAAPVSALSYNENTFTLRVEAGAANGAPPTVQTFPPEPGIPLVISAVTGRGRLHIRREHPGQPVLVEGALPRGGRDVWRQMTVDDPSRFTARILYNVLRERGIAVEGAVRTVSEATRSRVTGQRLLAPALGREAPRILGRLRSPPLRDYLEVVNKKSHNLFSELILKTLGRVVEGDGSYAAGTRVLEAFLADQVGVDTAVVELHDGSGLSGLNRMTASDLVRLMVYMADSGSWEVFWSTLPEAGNPRELRRMYRTAAAGNLRAKTGTIQNVSALTGAVRSANGERLAFSIIGNGLRSTWRAKRVEDRIGERLARFERPWEARRRGRAVQSASGVPAPGGLRPGAEPAIPSADPDAPSPAEREDPRRHLVRRGENFTVIARRYGVSLNELIEANPGISPRELQAGRWIVIPEASGRRPR